MRVRDLIKNPSAMLGLVLILLSAIGTIGFFYLMFR